jgi:hypothetical protein
MDIVERLMRQIETGPDVEDIVFINPDGPDAVDEIERLDAEIERLREALRKIAEFDLYGDYSNGYEIPKIAAHALLQQKDSE